MTDKKDTSSTPLQDTGHTSDHITRHDIATITIRVVGIYFIALSLQVIPQLFAVFTMSPPPYSPTTIYILLGGGIYMAVGILLLIFGKNWGWRLLPRAGPVQPRPTRSDLLEMAFAVVGVVLVANALVGITSTFIANSGTWPTYSPTGWRSYLGPVAQLAIGIALFLGARGLSVLWYRLRATSYGRDNP